MTTQGVTPFDQQFASAGVANNVDPDLLAAQAAVESSYNPSAVSPAGAQGLMQIMPATAKALGVSDRTDATQSINGGAKLMGQLITQYGNVPDALRAYAGGQNQANWGPQTQAYPGKVAAAYADIKRAGGIQYAQADNGNATDANTGAAPGRPSDAQMMQMMTGGGGSTASASAPAASSAASDAVQPIAGRPSDAAMMQMMTGGAPSPASASATPSGAQAPTQAPTAPATVPAASPTPTGGDVTQFPMVAPHPAPDGSGAMTNLSDADYWRFTGKTPPPAAAPATAQGAGQPPASARSAPAAPPLTAPTASPTAASDGTRNSTPPTALGELLSGGLDAYRGIARTIANGAAYVDSQHPWLKAGDDYFGEDPQQISNNLLNEIQADRKQAGSSPAYTAGNIGGNVLATLPLMELGGAGLGAAGKAVSAIPGVGDLLAGAGNAVRAMPGGDFMSKLLANGAKGAIQGAAAGAATSGASTQPFWDQVKQGAELGGVAGAALPAAVGTARGIKNTVLGGSTDADTATLAAQARSYGIPITLGQMSDNASVHALDSMSKRVPFSGSTGQAEAQQTAFNRSVGGTIGQPADKVTPQVMTAAKQQIGATLSKIEDNNPVKLDDPFITQVAAIEKNASLTLTDQEYGVVSRQLDNIMSNLQHDDTIAGQTYGNLIHKGSALDAALNNRDSNVANYAGQIKGALQDALTRSLSPADQATYTQARYQWKNLKTIEPLVEKSVTGDISPAGLMQVVRSSYGDMAYSGGGDLGNLARIGQRFLKEPPDSGTAGRLSALEGLIKAGGLGADVVIGAAHPGAIPAAAAATIGTIGAARAARAYLGSTTLANRLIERGLNPATSSSIASRLAGVATTTSPTIAALTGNRLLQPGQGDAQGR